MAAKTPSTIVRESAGSQTKLIATFTDVDNTDTWASGIPNVQDFYFVRTDAPSSYTTAMVTHSSGTFTFRLGEDDCAGNLVVFGKF